MSATSDGFAARLDAVRSRLEALSRARLPAGALTAEDPPTGERWEAGQVWAHLAEFIPYWIAQAERVLDGRDAGPAAFGRTKRDPERVGAIERGRDRSVPEQWEVVSGDITLLREFVERVGDDGWPVRGRHPTLGEMSVARLVDEFLVGHLEEHAEQLEGLAGR
ncbi:MAG: DinB family protein [Candidatus Dormibacteria bacterium]